MESHSVEFSRPFQQTLEAEIPLGLDRQPILKEADMSNTHKVHKGKWSELALWRRNRFSPPDRLFFPIVVALLLALAVIALLIKLF